MRMREVAGVLLMAAVVLVPGAPAAAGTKVTTKPELANQCVSIRSASAGVIVRTPDGYRFSKDGRPAAFYLKPISLRTTFIYGGPGHILSSGGPTRTGVQVVDAVDPAIEGSWVFKPAGGGRFSISSNAAAGFLTQVGSKLRVTGIDRPLPKQTFSVSRAKGCLPYPEASLGATGKGFKGTNKNGTVFGFADSHLHITANYRAGGRVIDGESYDPLGITVALGGDAENHGEDGSLDVTGNLLRTGLPFGGHDTSGWPTFSGWPTNGTNTHQQTYYMWLKRAWKAGLRLTVAQTVEDQPICEIEPLRSHTCQETPAIISQVRRLKGLQNYVDAQAGGHGRGWFRLAYSPKQARKVIEQGKLAVVIGVESSNPFDCSLEGGKSDCTRKMIDRRLDQLRSEGVRSMFLAHWVNNALAGPSPEGGIKGAFINVFNKYQTGSYLTVENCPDPAEGEVVEALSPLEIQILSNYYPKTAYLRDEPLPEYPDTPQCNTEGLTPLGAYAVKRMMDRHMLIELDHLSEKSREAVLEIAEARNYPLVSGHTGTGGAWSPDKLRRLYRLGGYASATPDQAAGFAARVLSFDKYRSGRHFFGVGLGSDTGGFSSLPGPAADAGTDPLVYPFRSYDGKVTFSREKTGSRTFDLNTDGVAHYGLFADLLAEVGRQPDGDRALASLFRSAEAYLRTWQLATSHK